MRCVVSTCNRDSGSAASQGITFHIFPSEPSLCAKWLKALSMDGWSPDEDSSVCSSHFLIKDQYLTKDGFCKLRDGAIPMVLKQDEPGIDKSAIPCNVQVCRICFTTDSNLYSMKLFKNLRQAYGTLTGLQIENEDNMPPYLCSECSHQLMNSVGFRRKILQAHLTLQEILTKNDCITLESIKGEDEDQGGNLSPGNLGTHKKYNYQVEVEHVKNEPDEQSPTLPTAHKDFIPEGIKKEKVELNQISDRDLDISHDMVYSPILHKYIVHDNIKVERDDECNMDSLNYHDSTSYDAEHINTFVDEDSAVASQAIREDEEIAQHTATHKDLINNLIQPNFDSHFKSSPETGPSFITNDNLSTDNSNYDTTAEKPFTCDICKKSFSQKSWLMNHYRIHSGERPYSCEICKKSFNDKSNYRKHLRIHSGERPFPCKYCDKAFNRKNYLENHLRTHSGEKPYSCSICNKEFGHKHHLKSHLRIHSGEKPYSCHICHKYFSEKSNLHMHMKVHSGTNLYSCEECKIPFTTKYLLKCHSRVHSGK